MRHESDEKLVRMNNVLGVRNILRKMHFALRSMTLEAQDNFIDDPDGFDVIKEERLDLVKSMLAQLCALDETLRDFEVSLLREEEALWRELQDKVEIVIHRENDDGQK